MSKSETIRVGIIGCGALGRVHADRLSRIEDVQVAAISDPSSAAVGEVWAMLPGSNIVLTSDYRDLLSRDLDAICIASPDGYHVRQVIDCLDAGLHVLCEKPLTMDSEGLEAVIHARDRARKHVSMTYPKRYDGGLRAMRREILSGRWGAVLAVTVYNAEDWMTPNVGTWRHDPAICPGGFLYDANGHQLDLVLWSTGLKLDSVEAEVSCQGTPVPIHIWGAARLTGGVPMTFHFIGNAHRWREQINIHCERMDFVVENNRASWTRGAQVCAIDEPESTEACETAFVRLIRGEGPNWAPPEDLRGLVDLTCAILDSAEWQDVGRL